MSGCIGDETTSTTRAVDYSPLDYSDNSSRFQSRDNSETGLHQQSLRLPRLHQQLSMNQAKLLVSIVFLIFFIMHLRVEISMRDRLPRYRLLHTFLALSPISSCTILAFRRTSSCVICAFVGFFMCYSCFCRFFRALFVLSPTSSCAMCTLWELFRVLQAI